jgi:hypothetical protein
MEAIPLENQHHTTSYIPTLGKYLILLIPPGSGFLKKILSELPVQGLL